MRVHNIDDLLKFAKIRQRKLDIPTPKTLITILQELNTQGFQALLIGGCVRDALLGAISKDIDVEVYGIDLNALATLLSSFGRASLEGKSFGVVKFTDNEGNQYDLFGLRDRRTGLSITFLLSINLQPYPIGKVHKNNLYG